MNITIMSSQANIGTMDSNENAEHCKSILSTMLRQEVHYNKSPYLATTKKRGGAAPDVACRAKVCRWMFSTIKSAGLQNETAIIAMNFLDRYMCLPIHRAKRARSNRREYQLIAMSCLYIAIKITEPSVMNATMIASLSRGVHKAEDIMCCERHILTSLKWRMNGPTPIQFANYMLQLLPQDVSTVKLSSKLGSDSYAQIECAIEDYACVPLRSSTIAIAAVLNSLENVSDLSFDSTKREFIQDISNSLDMTNVVESPLIQACRKRLLNKPTANKSRRSTDTLATPDQVEDGTTQTATPGIEDRSIKSCQPCSPTHVCATKEI